MKKEMTQVLVIGLAFLASGCFGAEHKELKAFPETKEGMERIVIVLPHKERSEEDAFKVELIPGKKMMTDGVNLMRLGTTIGPKPLKGWGYTYYEVTGSDNVMSTMMAAPLGGQQVEKFVAGASLLVRYNSRLPIVIYIPKGFQVMYNIWHAEIAKKADNG